MTVTMTITALSCALSPCPCPCPCPCGGQSRAFASAANTAEEAEEAEEGWAVRAQGRPARTTYAGVTPRTEAQFRFGDHARI